MPVQAPGDLRTPQRLFSDPRRDRGVVAPAFSGLLLRLCVSTKLIGFAIAFVIPTTLKTIMLRQSIGMLVCLVFSAGASAQSCQLTTLFAADTGGGAGWSQYFDLELAADVSIDLLALDINTSSAPGVMGGVDVYLTVPGGTHVGNEQMPVWTLAAEGVPAAAEAFNTPTTILLQTAVTLASGAAGERWGVALHYSGDIAPAYTDGTGTNQMHTAGPLTLSAGSSHNMAPGVAGTVFSPRVWNGTLYWDKFARCESLGQGCGALVSAGESKCYELFDGGTNVFDLAPTTGGWAGLLQVAGYSLDVDARGVLAPTGTPLAFGDDDTQAITLPNGPMPTSNGSISEIHVCSNGWISLEPTTDTDFSETVSELCSGVERICPLWDDLNPTAGGTIHAEADPADPDWFYVTWTDVPEFGGTATSTFQVGFQMSTGNFRVSYGVIGVLDCIVGYSPGQGVSDPGSRDFNGGGLPCVVSSAGTVAELSLAANARPVIGTTVSIGVDTIPSPGIGVVMIGTECFAQPVPLDGFGMPGCVLTGPGGAAARLFGTGSSSATVSLDLTRLPAGLTLCLQAAAVSPGINALGVVTSNGLQCTLDVQ